MPGNKPKQLNERLKDFCNKNPKVLMMLKKILEDEKIVWVGRINTAKMYVYRYVCVLICVCLCVFT